MSIFEILTKGGWLMIPIGLASIIAVAILVERLVSLRKIRINADAFISRVHNLLMRERVDEAIRTCEATPGPVAAITKAGLKKHNRSREEIKDAIESAAESEVYHLERYLGVLGTIAAIAPLIGFLGTVTGMIRAFIQIQTLGGNVDASVLAGGIWEALITTAAGLSVGIPSLIFYNWLQGKVEHHVFEMQESSSNLLDILLEREAEDEDRDE
ncbi:MAG: MotA/TolQ/ExbB proton channel family protein [Candidatus Marinimicrobia bacterium]|nr:MotA/TolQ/ExbB proton channel family protein [Candidatus Neomarinimicrobiota bacterium]MCF7828617.1 MotA/TolQ/ExbB proton channel family protein [Candidatus Neomarinimicrobiota bacterium]MCF7880358.1 MotA/TolQ/ExbB proton channel family protein [Candidatus Neomarinimicrobiota bacterium]